jgi:chemosensory pili system protein ChpA (sensor histidine kinase/response regulator)
MDDMSAHENVTEFLGEVEGYLPVMRGCLDAFEKDQADRSAAEELHRICHTIKGAAAMIGLNDLSKTGELLEDTMEQVVASALIMDSGLIGLFREAVSQIEAFCNTAEHEGPPPDSHLHQHLSAAFQKKLTPHPSVSSSPPAAEKSGDSLADILEQLLSGDVSTRPGDDFFLLDETCEETKARFAPKGIAIDPELLACFSEEAEEHLGNISAGLNRLAEAASEETVISPELRESLHSLRRSVHTLKGAAAVIGIEPVAAWGRELEDFLDTIHDDFAFLRPGTVAVMEAGSSLLARIAEEPGCAVEEEKQTVRVRFKETVDREKGWMEQAVDSSAAVQPVEPPFEPAPEDFFARKRAEESPETLLEQLEKTADDTGSLLQESGEEDIFAVFPELAAEQQDESAGPEPFPAETLFAEEESGREADALFDELAATSADDSLFAVFPEPAAKTEPSPPAAEPEEEPVDPELLQCFSEETSEHLENIDVQLNQLDAAAENEIALSPALREMLHSLRRSVHTLKGAAAVIGIKPVAAWGHKFEDFLDWLHDESPVIGPETVAAMREGADLLTKLAEEPGCDVSAEQDAVMIRFQEIIAAKPDVPQPIPAAELSPDEAVAATLFAGTGNETFGEDLPVAASSAVGQGDEAVDPELLACFAEEAAEHLENIDRQLQLLGQAAQTEVELGPSLRETLHSLRRSVHTLKGAAAVIGIAPIAAWGHEYEDFLDWLHDEAPVLGPGTVSLMQEAADLLAKIAENPDLPAADTKAALAARFKQVMAADMGGSSSSSVLPEEAVDPELFACFTEEAAEHLENIDRQLSLLGEGAQTEVELSPALKETLHSLRRSVHTLKGAAAVIGIAPIAAWGHEYEDFLDWLHDEAPVLGPDTVGLMQEAADLLAKIAENPDMPAAEAKTALAARFKQIMAGRTAESEPTAAAVPVPEVIAAPELGGGVRRINTLRVDVNRIDQVVGLSGDMVINLGGFEASMTAMSGTLNEMGMILQRLKNINTSLEAGYELATIPYLSGAADTGRGGLAEDFDPLEMDRYSELNIIIRSLSEAVSDLDSIMAQSALENVAWQKTVERQERVLKDIQNRMIGLRMTPLSVLSARMQRTVREAEKTTGHPAQLLLEGESLMMDTRVWDTMADALMHILRNAVAHGGRPDKRLTVRIKAERRGGQFLLRIGDDGRGLNYEAIRLKGMKLYPNEHIGSMSDERLAGLIFRHGFSSAGAITSIAGRGVGMDVVRDAVARLNGSIEIISKRGQGLQLLIRLPVAVAQLQAVLARLAGQVYAVPMHDIASVARITPAEAAAQEYAFMGATLPLVQPAAIPGFFVGAAGEPPAENELAALVIQVGSRRAALLCEQLIGQKDVVFKELGAHLQHVPCIAGVTVLGDGSLVPIVQTDELLRKWSDLNELAEAVAEVAPSEEKPLRILVVDDSISVRKVVSNFILQQGWLPVVARNGIEALERIREERPDFVLLDIEMPRMNGFEVLQALQGQAELRSLPVAMLTSRSADKYREKAAQLGARGFLNKPFKPDEVIELVRSLTGR